MLQWALCSVLGFLVTYRFRGRFRSCCFSYTIMSRLNVTTTKKKRFIVSTRILWARSSAGGVVILSGPFKAYWCNIMMAFRHVPYLLLSNLFTVNGFSPSKQARAKNLLLKWHCVALLEPNFTISKMCRRDYGPSTPTSPVLLVTSICAWHLKHALYS